jgi:hypothetical protein
MKPGGEREDVGMSSRERRVGEEEEEEAMVAAWQRFLSLFFALSFLFLSLSVSQCRRYEKAQNRDQNEGGGDGGERMLSDNWRPMFGKKQKKLS